MGGPGPPPAISWLPWVQESYHHIYKATDADIVGLSEESGGYFQEDEAPDGYKQPYINIINLGNIVFKQNPRTTKLVESWLEMVSACMLGCGLSRPSAACLQAKHQALLAFASSRTTKDGACLPLTQCLPSPPPLAVKAFCCN